MLTFLALAAGLIVWLAPESPLGKPLRRALVEWPAARLSRIRPGVTILLLLVIAAAAAMVLVARNEGAVLAAQGLPEAVAAIFALDLGTYFEMLAMAWLLAATVRLRVVKAVLASSAPRVRRWTQRCAPARAGTPRRRPAAPPANSDDEGWPGFALAA